VIKMNDFNVDESIGAKYIKFLCPECKEKYQNELEKANNSKFPKMALIKCMSSFYPKLCKKCRTALIKDIKRNNGVRK